MKPLTPLIQQHMYTRERSGIFRSTEGYDTIARSAGLDPNFIKKTLHPFCMYDAPSELSNIGEKDDALYPEAVHLFHTESGQTVLGCSVYKATDFTGLRSAFFTHNYVIPAERSKELLTTPVSWLNTTFSHGYEIEKGPELPELDQLPTASDADIQSEWNIESPAAMRSVLARLHIDENLFKQMLFAVMSAVANKKKVYIALDVPISQSSLIARKLFGILYASLPYAFRTQIGFLSYAKEAQSKKGIHVTFVEKGSLRPGDRSIEKDYTFDLAAQRVTNVDIDGKQQPYLDFAWRNLDRSERAESFYSYADLMLSDMDPARELSMTSYQELAVLFQIEEGKHSLYEDNRSAVLRILLDYLSPEGALRKKTRLHDLFLQIFNREYELVKQRHLPELAIVEYFNTYDQRKGSAIRESFIGYLISAINHALASQRTQEANAFYALIERNSDLCKQLFDKILNGGLAGTMFMPFFHNKLQRTTGAEEAVMLLEEWAQRHPQLLSLPAYSEMAEYHMKDKLSQSDDQVITANAVLEQLHQLESRKSRSSAGDSHHPFLEKLSYTVNLFLLTDLDLDKLTKKQLLQIGFLEQEDEFLSWITRFDQQVRSQAKVMLATYQWFSTHNPDLTIFDDLSPMELDRVQQLGQRWLQHELQPGQFDKLVLAFCRDTEDGVVEYGALLQFIHMHAREREIMYQFLNWSESHPSFTRARKLHPNYAAAIIGYFKRHDREAFKQRAYRKQYFDQAGPALEAVYDKVLYELSSPLARLFNRRKNVMIFSIATTIVIGGTVAGLFAAGVFNTTSVTPSDSIVAGNSSTEAVEPKVTSDPAVPAVQPEGEAQQPADTDPIVYAEQVKTSVEGADGAAGTEETETTQLVFEFQSAETCKTFQASGVSLKLADGKEQVLSNLNVTHACDAVPYQAKLPLAEKLELKPGQIIQVGDQEYTLSEPKQAEAQQSGAQQP